jgi:hypothetical protein
VTVAEYLTSIKERLTADRVVSSFQVIRERTTLTDGHLRARLTLTDDSHLEFSEYVQRSPNGEISVITYSYHWADMQNILIRRWDNTPHFHNLPGFPHHVHTKPADTPSPGHLVSIFTVLDEIARLITTH